MNIVLMHKLAFQNIVQEGDQKLMIDLEWPYNNIIIVIVQI